jgi:hypothetical protein
VPVYDLDEATGEATGHFALDMLSTEGLPTRAETHFLYAVGAARISGPTPVAFITEEELLAGV